jgi:hypothetical protein
MIREVKNINKISGSKVHNLHKHKNKHKKNLDNITSKYTKKAKKDIKDVKNSTKLTNTSIKHNHNTIQKGGSLNNRENFEIKSLDDIDLNVFKASNYINRNIDWGILGIIGPPPSDCTIL